jgi:hypothetical protein
MITPKALKADPNPERKLGEFDKKGPTWGPKKDEIDLDWSG